MKLMRADQNIKYLPSFIIITILAVQLPQITSAAQDVTAHSQINLTVADTDFNAGNKLSSGYTVNWTSGEDWEITIKSLDLNLGDSTDSNYTKPLSDLQWKLSTSETWNTMTTNEVTVNTGSQGNESVTIDYRVLLSWASDKPGSYGSTIEFKIKPLSRSIGFSCGSQSLTVSRTDFPVFQIGQTTNHGMKPTKRLKGLK